MLYIEELKGKSIRNLKNFSIKTNPSLNFFYGANASGKTSVLESIYLLSRLKSFRTKRISDVISRGDDKLQIFAAGRLKNKAFSVGVNPSLDSTGAGGFIGAGISGKLANCLSCGKELK